MIEKVWFNYKFALDLHSGTRWFPASSFEMMYKFYVNIGALKMVDRIIGDGKLKIFTFSNGKSSVTDERLGYLECDMDILSELGVQYPEQILSKLDGPGKAFDIQPMLGDETQTNLEQVNARIKRFTDLEEVEPGKFEIMPAGEDIEGNPTEPKYLIID